MNTIKIKAYRTLPGPFSHKITPWNSMFLLVATDMSLNIMLLPLFHKFINIRSTSSIILSLSTSLSILFIVILPLGGKLFVQLCHLLLPHLLSLQQHYFLVYIQATFKFYFLNFSFCSIMRGTTLKFPKILLHGQI